MKKKYIKLINIFLIALSVALSIMYINFLLKLYEAGFLFKFKLPILIISSILVVVLGIMSLIFLLKDKESLYKMISMLIYLITVALILFYYLKSSGFMDKFKTIEEFQKYLSSMGNFSVIIFILVQFLQVVILPIPSTVTIGAGVLLFGAFWGSIYSLIGIVSGSIVAFLIGRFLGYKVVKWFVGEDDLNKWLKKVEGKDKVIITFMFLLPMFPDDILCFIAGLSTMSIGYFSIMVLISRIITIFITSFSFSGNLIPYNTWWGLMIWGIICIATVICLVILFKKGDKIEKWFENKFSRKNKKEKK